MLVTTGKLRHSPKINGNGARRDGGSTQWWLVIDADPEIGKYYRQLYAMWSYRASKLQRPAWEAHISVVPDEEPTDELKPLWGQYDGQEIELDFDNTSAESDGVYAWFTVRCAKALDIREELGLTRQPYFPLCDRKS